MVKTMTELSEYWDKYHILWEKIREKYNTDYEVMKYVYQIYNKETNKLICELPRCGMSSPYKYSPFYLVETNSRIEETYYKLVAACKEYKLEVNLNDNN